MIEVGPL